MLLLHKDFLQICESSDYNTSADIGLLDMVLPYYFIKCFPVFSLVWDFEGLEMKEISGNSFFFFLILSTEAKVNSNFQILLPKSMFGSQALKLPIFHGYS